MSNCPCVFSCSFRQWRGIYDWIYLCTGYATPPPPSGELLSLHCIVLHHNVIMLLSGVLLLPCILCDFESQQQYLGRPSLPVWYYHRRLCGALCRLLTSRSVHFHAEKEYMAAHSCLDSAMFAALLCRCVMGRLRHREDPG
jgi:hypothetical protein